MDELLRRYAGEVKLIYMDPPFLTGEQFVMRARVGAEDWTAGKGSLVLPAFSDDLEPDAYYAMMRRVIEGCHSLLREDGMLFLHCDFRASARLRLILDDVFGEKNLFKRDRLGLPHRRHCAALLQPQARYHPLLPQDAQVRLQHRGRALPRPRSRSRDHMRRHVDPDGPRLPLHPLRLAASIPTMTTTPCRPRTFGMMSATCNSATRSARATIRKKPLALLERIVKCASREGELVFDPFAGSGTTLEAAFRLGRRFVGVDKCALVPNILRRRLEGAPWELLREAELIDAPCAVEVLRGVGFYHVKLADAPVPWQMLDNWALGYLRGEEFRVETQAARAKKAPELPWELEVPVYDGEIGLRLSDVRGKTYYYKLPYEKN